MSAASDSTSTTITTTTTPTPTAFVPHPVTLQGDALTLRAYQTQLIDRIVQRNDANDGFANRFVTVDETDYQPGTSTAIQTAIARLMHNYAGYRVSVLLPTAAAAREWLQNIQAMLYAEHSIKRRNAEYLVIDNDSTVRVYPVSIDRMRGVTSDLMVVPRTCDLPKQVMMQVVVPLMCVISTRFVLTHPPDTIKSAMA